MWVGYHKTYRQCPYAKKQAVNNHLTPPGVTSPAALSDIRWRRNQNNPTKINSLIPVHQWRNTSGAHGYAPFPPFFQFFFRLHWQHRPSPFRTHILLVKSHPRCFFCSLSSLLVTCVGILICCVWTCQNVAGLTVVEEHNGHRCLGYTNTFCIKTSDLFATKLTFSPPLSSSRTHSDFCSTHSSWQSTGEHASGDIMIPTILFYIS